jgi:arabinan endo-1,5-alpha-L-arabinosidase
MKATLFMALLMAAAVSAAEPTAPSFTLRLPSVKPGYPGAEYWAEIESPDGKRVRAFAVFTGEDRWSVPFRLEVPGACQLLRLEKRQGDQHEPVALGEVASLRLEASPSGKRVGLGNRALVEAGTFTNFFAAEAPWCINDHALVQGPDGWWHLFGITHPKPLDFFKDPGRRLAHATARSLLEHPWQAQAPTVTADWDRYREYLLWAPHVIRHADQYYLFVCVGDRDTHRYRLHLLTSPDLKDWTRHPANPMVIDGFDGRDPMVMPLGSEWVMYYTATSTPEGGNHVVACVRSQDLVHWTDRRVVFMHPQVGTFGGPTESPFVVGRGDQYYLFVCDNDWTDVYGSRDPFCWDFEDKVGRIHSHASEIVRDGAGQWFISHAGWMNGPVALASLNWRDGLDAAPASVPPGRE